MTFMKREGNGNWKRKQYIALCGEFTLAQAVDLSQGILRNGLIYTKHGPPLHLVLPDFCNIIIIGEGYQLLFSLLWYFLHPSATPNILRTLLYYEINLNASINFRDQLTHPCKQNVKLFKFFYFQITARKHILN